MLQWLVYESRIFRLALSVVWNTNRAAEWETKWDNEAMFKNIKGWWLLTPPDLLFYFSIAKIPQIPVQVLHNALKETVILLYEQASCKSRELLCQMLFILFYQDIFVSVLAFIYMKAWENNGQPHL